MKFERCLIFLTIAFFALLTQCRKNKEGPPSTLPPITQAGRNTFGCKIDGQVWVPYYSCNGFSADPCGELDVNVFTTTVSDPIPLSFSIGAALKQNGPVSSLIFNTQTNHGIWSVGNKFDSVDILYTTSYGTHYYSDTTRQGSQQFEITRLDTANHIISGVFDITLYKSFSDSVKITEGRFDLKFAVCKCSK